MFRVPGSEWLFSACHRYASIVNQQTIYYERRCYTYIVAFNPHNKLETTAISFKIFKISCLRLTPHVIHRDQHLRVQCKIKLYNSYFHAV